MFSLNCPSGESGGMSRRSILYKLTLFLLLSLPAALNASPKAKQPRAATLPERFNKLACAVVHLVSNGEIGTGFFINNTGDVLTAFHIAFNSSYTASGTDSEQGGLGLSYRKDLTLKRTNQPPLPLIGLLPTPTQEDRMRAQSDVAILHTGIKTDCALKISSQDRASMGDHVISIGYPLDSGPTLYEGFVSGRYPHPEIPTAVLNGQPVYSRYNVIQIQMPVSAGASGSPIIADDDVAIGVLTEDSRFWYADLSLLMDKYESRPEFFSASPSDQVPPGSFDLQRLLALLAYFVQNYTTTGLAVAVPTNLIRVHADRAAQDRE